MQFNSYIFILVVIPAFVLCYFLLSKIKAIAGKLVIISFGIWFYIYGGLESTFILGVSLFVNFFFSIILYRVKRSRKLFLTLAILANIGLLLYFKYTNFILMSFNSIFGKDLPLKEIMLPLGISFFTFQQIMYILAVYRGDIEKVDSLDYLSYALYFPKLIMGPLMEPKDFIDQINDPEKKKINWENIACGIKIFSLGLFKKLVLADSFALGVSWGFNHIDSASSGDLFLVMLFYTFEIYFD